MIPAFPPSDWPMAASSAKFDPDRPRVFISYARRDGQPFAAALRQKLETEASDLRLWQDLVSMEGGKDWWRQITEALDAVEYMVLVLTPAAVASPIVQKEWRYARSQGVCVVPVVGMPGAEVDLGTLPRWMKKVHI